MIIAAIKLKEAQKLTDEKVKDAIILLVLATCFLGPVLF